MNTCLKCGEELRIWKQKQGNVCMCLNKNCCEHGIVYPIIRKIKFKMEFKN